MYNICDFLHFPAWNNISAGKWKKLEILYITWLNVVGNISIIAVPKSKMY